MNIVFCVCRPWNIKILEGLIRIQKTKKWKVNLIIAPTGTEISQLNEMEISYIQPTQLENYSDTIKSKKPEVIICYGWSWKNPKMALPYFDYYCVKYWPVYFQLASSKETERD